MWRGSIEVKIKSLHADSSRLIGRDLVVAPEPRTQLHSLLLGRGPLSCRVALFADEVDQGAEPGGNMPPSSEIER
jgi:hypothetical protein